jgi:hypothetical protein
MTDKTKITYEIKLPKEIPGWNTQCCTFSLWELHDGKFHSNQNFVSQEAAETAMKWNMKNDAKEQR